MKPKILFNQQTQLSLATTSVLFQILATGSGILGTPAFYYASA
jgi:hypothetical protein